MASSAPTPVSTMAPTQVSNEPAPTCTTAVPGEYGHVPVDACNSNYNYEPQYIPAVVASVIFGVFTLVHIAEAAVFKKRYAWVVCMGALWETAAFVLGAIGAHDQQNSQYAVYHLLLFLLAPLWINAFVYMTLARMMHFYLPDQKVWKIKSTSMSKIFVWADVVTFLIQAGGGSMAGPGVDAQTLKIGLNVYTAGVGLQEACILAFIWLMIIFHRKAAALDQGAGFQRTENGDEEYFIPKKGWKAQIYALYIVLALITVRIAYRIAEFASGMDPTTNPLPFHEEYAYGLDAAPMMVALLVLIIWHPGRILQGRNADFTEHRKQKKAAKKAKKEAKKALKAEKKAAKQGKQMNLDERDSVYAPYQYESV